MNSQELTYLNEQGYHIVAPSRMFGRSAELQHGEVNTDGCYREVEIEDMFGAYSERGIAAPCEAYAMSLTASPMFQSLVLATLIVYLTILLRSWGFIRSIWSDILRTNNDARMVFEGGELPLQRFKLTTAILGITTVSLVIIRLAEYFIPPTSEIYNGVTYFIMPLIAIFGMMAYLLWNFTYHKVIGLIIGGSDLAMLSHIGYTNFVRSVILLYPIAAVWLLTNDTESSTSGIMLIIFSCTLLLLYLKDTFIFFHGKKISIFYWILYLCTAILLPWSFTAKLLAINILQ